MKSSTLHWTLLYCTILCHITSIVACILGQEANFAWLCCTITGWACLVFSLKAKIEYDSRLISGEENTRRDVIGPIVTGLKRAVLFAVSLPFIAIGVIISIVCASIDMGINFMLDRLER